MAQKQLNLFQIPSRFPAQFGAGPPQIVRRQRRMPDGGARAPDERVDYVFADGLVRGPESVALAQRPEQRPSGDLPGFEPAVENPFHPERDRHGADPPSLPLQVELHPALVAQLQVPDLQADELVAAQPAGNEQSKNSPVPNSNPGVALH